MDRRFATPRRSPPADPVGPGLAFVLAVAGGPAVVMVLLFLLTR
jgi:hypothetical protein